MSKSIERAIDALVAKQEPINVRNVIAAYLQIVNFNGGDVQLDDAMVAFEHALDKHPIPLAGNNAVCYYRPYILEVDQLRREYWAERMGGAKCTCGKCGCPIFEDTPPPIDAYDPTVDVPYGTIKEKRKVKGGKRASPCFLIVYSQLLNCALSGKSMKKRVTKKRVADPNCIALLQPADPLGPSTSTAAP